VGDKPDQDLEFYRENKPDTHHSVNLATNKCDGLIPFSGSAAVGSRNIHSVCLQAVSWGLKRLKVTPSLKKSFSEISVFCVGMMLQ
jgi:hypothetical protein